MSILVVVAIAVMVLLVLGVFFTGGFRSIGTNMMSFIGGTGGDESATTVTNCNQWCLKAEIPYMSLADPPTGCQCTEGVTVQQECTTWCGSLDTCCEEMGGAGCTCDDPTCCHDDGSCGSTCTGGETCDDPACCVAGTGCTNDCDCDGGGNPYVAWCTCS